jgi:hypothetical protein
VLALVALHLLADDGLRATGQDNRDLLEAAIRGGRAAASHHLTTRASVAARVWMVM